MLREFKLFTCLAVAAAPWLLAVPGTASADEVFKATSAITVVGNPLGSFDISFVDPVLGIYLLADRSNKDIDVVTTNNNSPGQLAAGTFVGVQPGSDTSGPNGVITANNHKEVWAADGPALSSPFHSHVVVIDYSSGAVTHSIDTGGVRRADELCEDPQHHVVLVANDDALDLFVTFISTSSYSVVGKIKLDGTDPNGRNIKATNGIEQCQWNPRTNKFYLAIPEVSGPGDDSAPGAVLEINASSMKVEKVFPVDHSKCGGPQGMAIGPDRQILLGCSNAGPGSVIIDALNGGVIYNLPGLNGNDEVWYNLGDNQYFLAGSNHTGGPILGVVDAASGSEDQTVGTAAGSHSVAADLAKNQVYVPVNNTAAAQASKACSSAGGTDAKGCILVLTTTNDDRAQVGK